MRRKISDEELEEFNYKLKVLLREENNLIKEILSLRRKRKEIKKILETHIEDVIDNLRNIKK